MSDTAVHSYLVDYIGEHGEPLEAPTRCSGCFQRPAVASDTANEYCEVCWASQRGNEQGEQAVIQMISSAVLNAIRDAGLDQLVVRQVIQYLVDPHD